MKFWGDYHTHTVYSHGKGTVLDNATRAFELGLKEIGITDHGFRHMAYNARRADVAAMQRDIRAADEKFPELKVYFGLETNLTGRNGEIDIRPEDMEFLDLLLCGFHKFVVPNRLSSAFDFYFPAFFASLIKKTSASRKVKNTDAYIKAIIKNDIDILTHLNYGIVSDPAEVAKCAKEYGTYIELNGKHVDLSDTDLLKMIDTGVNFIVDSDAHSVSRVGEVNKPIATIERVKIPEAQIANLNKKPVFRSRVKRGLV